MSGTVADNIDRQSGVIAEPAGGPEVRSDDPSASEGTVWFNTTSDVLKVFRNVGAWSSGGNSTLARYQVRGCGTLTAGLNFGGNQGGRVATGPSVFAGCTGRGTLRRTAHRDSQTDRRS